MRFPCNCEIDEFWWRKIYYKEFCLFENEKILRIKETNEIEKINRTSVFLYETSNEIDKL